MKLLMQIICKSPGFRTKIKAIACVYAGTFQNLFFKIIRLRLSAQKPTKRNEEEERKIDPKWIPLLVCLVDWLKVDSVFFKKALIWSKPFCKWNIQIQHELIYAMLVWVCVCAKRNDSFWLFFNPSKWDEMIQTRTHNTNPMNIDIIGENGAFLRIFVMVIIWRSYKSYSWKNQTGQFTAEHHDCNVESTSCKHLIFRFIFNSCMV